MTEATMIPVLPAVAIEATLAFYRALGFVVTYEQHKPYGYAAIERAGVSLHFVQIKQLDPKAAYSTCLALVPEVEGLHATFAAALRQALGKLPVAGIPRISRMKPGQGRFTLVDVAGNSIIFLKRDAPGEDEAWVPKGGDSRLGKALQLATRLRDFKNDDPGAAKVLDGALARPDAGAARDRARVLVARLELAVVLGEGERGAGLRAELAGLVLTADERAGLAAELARVDALVKSQG